MLLIEKIIMTKRRIDVNPLNALPIILILIAVFVALWFVAKSIFTLLAWVAPVLIIAAAVINYKVVLGYGTFLFNLLKRNPLMGIIGIVMSFFFFPVVSLFLLGKALLYRKVDTLKKEFEAKHGGGTTDGEYTEYEEIEIPKEEKPLELPRRPLQEKQNEYEELFDDDV